MNYLKTGLIMMAFLLAGIAMVPAVSAATINVDGTLSASGTNLLYYATGHCSQMAGTMTVTSTLYNNAGAVVGSKSASCTNCYFVTAGPGTYAGVAGSKYVLRSSVTTTNPWLGPSTDIDWVYT